LKITIEEMPTDCLTEYKPVPGRVEVKSILPVYLINQSLGGMLLCEVPVDVPFLKDYDVSGELPSNMA
jgi:hypothetical protein